MIRVSLLLLLSGCSVATFSPNLVRKPKATFAMLPAASPVIVSGGGNLGIPGGVAEAALVLCGKPETREALASAAGRIDWEKQDYDAAPFEHAGSVVFVKGDGEVMKEVLSEQMKNAARDMGANIVAIRHVRREGSAGESQVIMQVDAELYRLSPCP